MDGLIGSTLGPYRIVERIGRGGMAAVYKAYQPSLDRYVAIKVLPAHLTDEPGFAERFKREARAVAKLEHPHILAVYDYGQEGDQTYIAMRYVEGGTLKDLLSKPLELPLIVDLIGQIAEALDYAHEHGVIHRDVKPSNVLLDKGNWALLTDFGVARMVEATQQLTGTGVGVGTPAYMSPEQGQGKKVDRRSDVYSLGVVLYEMLTGRVPFEAETPLAVVWKHVNEPLPLPRSINSDIPEPVERVVLKALAKAPDDRFQSASQFGFAFHESAGKLAADQSLYGVGKAASVAAELSRLLERRKLKHLTWLAPLLAVVLGAIYLAREARVGRTEIVVPPGNAQVIQPVTIVELSRPVILVDQAHDERQTISLEVAQEKDSSVGFAYAYLGDFALSAAADYGLDTHVSGPLTSEDLDGSRVLLLAAPKTQFTTAEVKAVEDFVSSGGGLLLWYEGWYASTYAANRLLARFGIEVRPGMLESEVDTLWENSFSFWATEVHSHPITKNVQGFLLDAGTSLEISGNAVPLIATGPETWRDANENHARDPEEPSGPFIVAAATQFGEGRVVVFGDDSFANLFSYNADLLFNALAWLAEPGK